MSSRNEMDYDRQFQDDLEKATALSLETLALEQFRRNKSGFSDVTDNAAYREASPPLYSTVMGSRPRPGSFSNTVQHSSSTGSLAPPPIVPPRRHSEVRVLDAQQQQQPQTAAKNEPDLISFTSPTQSASATAQQPDPHSKFVQMVDQLHNFNAQLQVVRPAYGFQPQMMPAGNSNASAAGLQLVPYTQQQQSAQKVPLTAEQLDKLYNMNYAAPQQHHHPQQVVAPPAGFTTVPITSQQQQQQQHNMQGYRQPMAAGFYQYGFNVQQTPPAHLEQRTFGQTVQQQPNTTFQHNMTFGQAQQQQQHAHAVASTTVMTVAVPESSLILPQPVIAGSMPKSQIQSGGGVIPASASALSYSSGVVRRNKKMVGDDLIDLENGEDNSRVSVLQAFDPFLEHSDDDDDKGKRTKF